LSPPRREQFPGIAQHHPETGSESEETLSQKLSSLIDFVSNRLADRGASYGRHYVPQLDRLGP
jgi:hypothetical protein